MPMTWRYSSVSMLLLMSWPGYPSEARIPRPDGSPRRGEAGTCMGFRRTSIMRSWVNNPLGLPCIVFACHIEEARYPTEHYQFCYHHSHQATAEDPRPERHDERESDS